MLGIMFDVYSIFRYILSITSLSCPKKNLYWALSSNRWEKKDLLTKTNNFLLSLHRGLTFALKFSFLKFGFRDIEKVLYFVFELAVGLKVSLKFHHAYFHLSIFLRLKFLLCFKSFSKLYFIIPILVNQEGNIQDNCSIFRFHKLIKSWQCFLKGFLELFMVLKANIFKKVLSDSSEQTLFFLFYGYHEFYFYNNSQY